MSEQDALLATKLHVPRPHPGFVVRPRLLDRLDQGASVCGVNPGRRACFFICSERDSHHVQGTRLAAWVVTVAGLTAIDRGQAQLWGEEPCGVPGRR